MTQRVTVRLTAVLLSGNNLRQIVPRVGPGAVSKWVCFQVSK